MTEYCMMVFKNKKYYGLRGFKQLYAAINPDVTIGEFTALCLDRQEEFHNEKKEEYNWMYDIDVLYRDGF